MQVRARYRRAAGDMRIMRGKLVDRLLRPLVLLAVVLTVIATAAQFRAPLLDRISPLWLALIWGGVAAAAVLLMFARRDAGLPRREQQRYRKLGKMAPLTPEQQRLLALDAVSDWQAAGWNSSLEYVPARVRLTAQGHQKASFLILPIVEPNEVRGRIQNESGAVTAPEFSTSFEYAFQNPSASQRFADVLAAPAQHAKITELAELTGQHETRIRELGRSENTQPPTLLRGFDVMRLIQWVRLGYMAGYFTEPEAWDQLSRLGQVARQHFSTPSAYWGNVRTGIAFTQGSTVEIEQFDQSRVQLAASNWPAAEILEIR